MEVGIGKVLNSRIKLFTQKIDLYSHFLRVNNNYIRIGSTHSVEGWKIHRGLTSRKMRSEGWMSIWVMKVQSQMDTEKARNKA